MAFQPIVDLRDMSVMAYEALVRGTDGAGAAAILDQITDENRYAFDQTCRVTAIETAHKLGLTQKAGFLSINFLPSAVYEPRACIRVTLQAALETGFPASRIMFELTETEKADPQHILHILRTYKSLGFKTAIDDFGAGYSGLNLLAEFQPDFVKLDMQLTRKLDSLAPKQKILRHTLAMLSDLGIEAICEGIETVEEMHFLQELGVNLMQGYLFAKPEIDRLPDPGFGAADSALPTLSNAKKA